MNLLKKCFFYDTLFFINFPFASLNRCLHYALVFQICFVPIYFSYFCTFISPPINFITFRVVLFKIGILSFSFNVVFVLNFTAVLMNSQLFSMSSCCYEFNPYFFFLYILFYFNTS